MSQLNDVVIINSLNEQVLKIAKSFWGEKTSFYVESPQRINRRYSFIFRYLIQTEDGEEISLFAKIPHQDDMKMLDEAIRSEQLRNEVQFEYQVMKSVAQVIANSQDTELTAINPIACILELNAIVMQEIKMTMLKDYVVKPQIMLGLQSSWREFSVSLNLAGKWLKVIHQKFSEGKQVEVKKLDAYRRVHEALSFFETRNITSIPYLCEKFVNSYNLIADLQVNLSSAHDDYHLGNIFVAPHGKVGALDFNWKEHFPIYNDLSKLLTDPSTRKMQLIFQGLTFPSTLQQRYEDEILKGYFGKTPFDAPILWFYCALAVLEKWKLTEELLETQKKPFWLLLRPVFLASMRHYFLKLIIKYLEK